MTEKEIISSFNKLLEVWQRDIPNEKINDKPLVEFANVEEKAINIKIRDNFLTDFKTLYSEGFNKLFKNTFGTYEYVILNDSKKPNYYVRGNFNQKIIDSFTKQLSSQKTFHNEYVQCPIGSGRTTLINYLVNISNGQAQSFNLDSGELQVISDVSKGTKIILLDNFESINNPKKSSTFIKLLSKFNYNKISVFMFSSIKPEDFLSTDLKNILKNVEQSYLHFPNVTKLKTIISQTFSKISSCKLTDDAIDFLAKLDFNQNFFNLVQLLNRVALWNTTNPEAIITQKDIEKILSSKDTQNLHAKHVISCICNIHNVNVEDITSFQKNKTIKSIRDGIVFLLRSKLKLDFKTIAKLLKKSESYVKSNYSQISKKPTFVNSWNNIYNTQL